MAAGERARASTSEPAHPPPRGTPAHFAALPPHRATPAPPLSATPPPPPQPAVWWGRHCSSIHTLTATRMPLCDPNGAFGASRFAGPQDIDRTDVARFEPYVTSIVKAFASDHRVAWWEISNEPQKGNNFSLALRDAGYRWATAQGPVAPVVSCWDDNNDTQVVDRHQYSAPWGTTGGVFLNPSKGGIVTEAGCRCSPRHCPSFEPLPVIPPSPPLVLTQSKITSFRMLIDFVLRVSCVPLPLPSLSLSPFQSSRRSKVVPAGQGPRVAAHSGQLAGRNSEGRLRGAVLARGDVLVGGDGWEHRHPVELALQGGRP